MITLGWMTDPNRVIGSHSTIVNMWRFIRFPSHLKTVMEKDIYNGQVFAAGPMMSEVIAKRAQRVYYLTRKTQFRSPAPNIVQIADADKLGRTYATSETELLVIGGKTVFELLLPYASKLHIAQTDRNYSGNVVFDAWETAPGFALETEEKWNGGRTLCYIRGNAYLAS